MTRLIPTSKDIDVPISSHRRHLKKPFPFGEKTIIVIDEEIVKQLGIDDTTWLEQEATDSGILMKVKNFTTEDKGDETL